ncbi:MAG TPA: helix-turn-helix domain-containing protein [Bacteroidia bacterium]|jgi:hypothetical protein
MALEVITREDLQEFRSQLLEDFKAILSDKQTSTKREWLKSFEVRRLLKISPGTLQNLRINGTLTYTKIGSIIFYSSQDIEKLMEKNKIDHTKS